ncbi:heterokaryon incompatibility protein-domain-containing protein [Lasiosphaeria hispida]|uniref:Heterokaryon incompatibility protein-domain-containing protein n=1 Tax=Lasiosphaeria hispida TaxID=260671 RepID=A0AAJ0MFG6_9PEZI|nr:heterokaryon incompatibility protein-domain-containing protein [Lasiosphaeria hispida]
MDTSPLSRILHSISCRGASLKDYYDSVKGNLGYLVALVTPVTYCGFCLFPLPQQGAWPFDGFADKWSQRPDEPSSRTRFPLEHVQASGFRGCKVCMAISEAIRRYCQRPVVRLEWHQSGRSLHPYEQDTDDASTSYMGASVFRLLFDAVETADLGVLQRHPYVVENPNPEGRIDVESCARSLNFWLGDCSESHEKCKVRASNPLLPTRVIRITDNGGPHPVVRLMESKGSRGEYVCLSHCWGELRPTCITTRDTYQRNITEIPWSSLPQTFQDAVSVTKLLGKEFLWIDSICIIQGDDVDWRAEAARMCTVYENAFLTLMATKAKDGRDGLLRSESSPIAARIPDSSLPGQLFFRQQSSIPSLGWGDMRAGGGVRPEVNPLLGRAWAFQERCLSFRAAHFTADGILYECIQSQVSDWSHGRGIPGNLNHGQGSRARLANAREFAAEWARIASAYSGLKLTNDRDRLPALAGMARQLASRGTSSGYHPGRYLAGLWEDTFHWDVMWTPGSVCDTSEDDIPTPCSEYIAPTWSWASFKSSMTTWSRTRCDLSLKDFQIGLTGPDEFGEVSSLTIRVSSRLLHARIWHENQMIDGIIEDIVHQYRLDVGFGSFIFYPDHNALWSEEHVFEDGTPVICIPAYMDGTLNGFLVLMDLDGSSNTFSRIGVTLSVRWGTQSLPSVHELLQKQREVVITLV